MKREFCRKEIRWALAYQKTIVLLWKQEGSGAVQSFGRFFADCHEVVNGDVGLGIENVFSTAAAIPYFTNSRFHDASMAELTRQLGFEDHALGRSEGMLYRVNTESTPTTIITVYNPENGAPQLRSIMQQVQLCLVCLTSHTPMSTHRVSLLPLPLRRHGSLHRLRHVRPLCSAAYSAL